MLRGHDAAPALELRITRIDLQQMRGLGGIQRKCSMDPCAGSFAKAASLECKPPVLHDVTSRSENDITDDLLCRRVNRRPTQGRSRSPGSFLQLDAPAAEVPA